jgi:hypothetical protein
MQGNIKIIILVLQDVVYNYRRLGLINLDSGPSPNRKIAVEPDEDLVDKGSCHEDVD